MKAALYARVPSEKQAEKDLSIPAQLKALQQYALQRGWDIFHEYIDEAESARTADRPKFSGNDRYKRTLVDAGAIRKPSSLSMMLLRPS